MGGGGGGPLPTPPHPTPPHPTPPHPTPPQDAIIRLDMSEYMERHTVSKLIGAPRECRGPRRQQRAPRAGGRARFTNGARRGSSVCACGGPGPPCANVSRGPALSANGRPLAHPPSCCPAAGYIGYGEGGKLTEAVSQPLRWPRLWPGKSPPTFGQGARPENACLLLLGPESCANSAGKRAPPSVAAALRRSYSKPLTAMRRAAAAFAGAPAAMFHRAV
jgi:hypothetical protein